MNEFSQVILLLTLGMIPVVIFCRSLSCLIEIRREWRRRFLLVTGSYVLIYMDLHRGPREFYECHSAFLSLYVGCVQRHQTQTSHSRSHACKHSFSLEWIV